MSPASTLNNKDRDISGHGMCVHWAMRLRQLRFDVDSDTSV